ncbi:hypothetical protein ACFVJ5_08415 [Nocardia sp. NPDC127606]|uniref:hypothetical protein n=1 Tax=Nocardia sp. NPDC127606 TaxID=3345406 RepID=UPI00363498F7
MTPEPSDPTNPDNNVTPLPIHRVRHRDRVTVERIETTPITPEQNRRAVTALAALINEWNNRHDNPEQFRDIAA